MKQKITFFQTIKEKWLPITGFTIVWTFLFVKVVDIILNWYINKDVVQMGPAVVRYNITIAIFSPIIFIIFFVLVTLRTKKKLIAALALPEESVKERPSYWGNYVWQDIFKDRKFFGLFAGVTASLCMFLYGILQWLSGLSDNFAIMTLSDTPFEILIVVAALPSIKLTLFLKNVVMAWFVGTEKGNQIIAKVVFAFGAMTALVASGVEYLFKDPDTAMDEYAQDYALGMLIPIDLPTTFFAIVTVFFWFTAKKCPWCDAKLLKKGFLLAVISFVISLTPLQSAIQMFWVVIVEFLHA